MTLEDCTKDELIYFIKHTCSFNAKSFEFDVLMHRAKAADAKSTEALTAANALLGEYCELIKPYAGKPISTMPNSIVSKAAQLMQKRDALFKAYDRFDKQYNKIQKQIDVLQGRG